MKAVIVFLIGCVIGWLVAPRRELEPVPDLVAQMDTWTWERAE